MNAEQIDPPTVLSRSSRLKSLILLILCIIITLGCLWLVTAAAPTRYPTLVTDLVGWVGSLFFGVGSLIPLADLLVPAHLRINRDGFSYNSLWRHWHVRWDDIELIDVRTQFGTRNVIWRRKTRGQTTRIFDHDGVLPGGWTHTADELCDELINAKVRYDKHQLA
ncbi:STM3941 family protein [Croceicoccus gelatinilyticus]|uniref:STM3941 family protein n=1 Tax=Croceicoccus gelatinilyticus TaxID=2835536 RepID=UPI001BCD561D|nr:STM3941 family protein [Croceicoccus gelatinilyticus]MBS7670940.1 hypothetical protein [Croceicoccus gelatinilyticus]